VFAEIQAGAVQGWLATARADNALVFSRLGDYLITTFISPREHCSIPTHSI